MSDHSSSKQLTAVNALTAAAVAGANALPLDEAARIPVGPGLEGRYGLCPTKALIPNPHSVRVHSKRQLGKLRRAIDISGNLSPAIIDEDYIVLAGHARLEVAKQIGAAGLPVIQVLGLSPAQKRAFALADNRISADAKLDRKALADQLSDLTILFEEAGFELTDTGYEVAELDELVLDFEDEHPHERDGGADFNGKAVARVGDLFQLGDHRLIIGDAREEACLDRLMQGERAEAAFLDVPYNVHVRNIGGRGRVQHPEFAFASGEMSQTEFVSFLSVALRNAARVSAPGAVHFVCIDWKHVRDLIEAGEAAYDAYLNLAVWTKSNAGQGGLYRNQHELIGVFRVGEEPHRDNVQRGRFGRNRSNVWAYAGANTFRAGRLEDLADHPTVKPTALVSDALKDVTRRGAVVLDSFVGSGTTIQAGERVGRQVRAAEISPTYAQVAIRRWEAMTGREAVHIESGLTLEALALQRDAEAQPAARAPEKKQQDDVARIAPVPRVRVRSRPPA